MQMHHHHELSGSWRTHRAPFGLICAMQAPSACHQVAQTDLHLLCCASRHATDTKVNAKETFRIACRDRTLASRGSSRAALDACASHLQAHDGRPFALAFALQRMLFRSQMQPV
jgi:hypothetical protein